MSTGDPAIAGAGPTPPARPVAALDGDALVDALSRAVLVVDRTGVVLRCNTAAERLLGRRASLVVGRPLAGVLAGPRDEAGVGDGLPTRLAGAEAWSGDVTFARPDGETVLVQALLRPVRRGDDVVAAVIEAEDVGDRRCLEQRMADLAEHFDLALEAGGLGTWRWDLASGLTVWDDRLEALHGLEPGTFGGTYEAWLAGQHPDDRAQVVATVEEAVREKRGYVVEHRVVWPDGTVRWIQGRGQVVLDDDGEVVGTIGCVMDVTDQVLAGREVERRIAEANAAAERERLHRERLEFLSRVNEQLRLSGDMRELMQRVTAAAVPRLGDWCSLVLVPEDGEAPQIEVAHVDPEMVAFARQLQERFPYDPDAPEGVAEVIRTGEAQYHPEITDELIDAADVPEEARPILRRLALRSSVIVPLRRGERVLGAMQFVMSQGSRAYEPDDVALAEAVAARIAASVEVRRLADRQRDIALTLQKSLLPAALPDIPGVEVAVRYWAAGEATEVGGDFYDVFEVDDDRWGVAIGDVCGTGPAAAAVTALARHTIRAAAWHGDDPATVLRSLNTALQVAGQDDFVTAVFGTLVPEGGVLHLAVAGHPLPVLVRPDGTAATVGRPGTLLGPYADPVCQVVPVPLEPGSTLVLYTDGVTDVPPPHDLDEAATVALVAEAAGDGPALDGLTADQVADRIHARLSARLPVADRSDDIALLIVRAGGT